MQSEKCNISSAATEIYCRQGGTVSSKDTVLEPFNTLEKVDPPQ